MKKFYLSLVIVVLIVVVAIVAFRTQIYDRLSGGKTVTSSLTVANTVSSVAAQKVDASETNAAATNATADPPVNNQQTVETDKANNTTTNATVATTPDNQQTAATENKSAVTTDVTTHVSVANNAADDQASHQPANTSDNNSDADTDADQKSSVATAAVNPAIHGVYDGKVIDADSKAPIADAPVTLGDQMVRTAADGSFHIDGMGNALKVRAPGYARQEFATTEQQKPPTEIALKRFVVKGLYITDYGLISNKISTNALAALKRNNMNTLVINVKDDRGLIYFKMDAPMVAEVGAQQKVFIKDMPALIADLKAQGLYLIGRIAIFKDNALAEAKPEWAVKKNGGMYRDNEKIAWTDPFIPEVKDYNIGIAKAAAAIGFDEIQIDYVRFPDAKGETFSQPSTKESRSKTIADFMGAMHQALIPYNVNLSADIFGYVLWNTDDTGIGQEIDKIVNAVDIVSPMLYPSGFEWGIPGYRNPVEHSYEIIYLSLKKGQERTNTSSLRFRPWLQAFRDYAFGGGDFSEDRMRTQIQATEDFGAEGYIFWNPRNVYPKGIFTDTKPKEKKQVADADTASTTE